MATDGTIVGRVLREGSDELLDGWLEFARVASSATTAPSATPPTATTPTEKAMR